MKNEDINLSKPGPELKHDDNRALIAGLMVALVLVLIIGTVITLKTIKKRKQEAGIFENQKLELAIQLSQRDSIINEWVLAFNEIESDIKKITARENMLSLQSMNPEITKDKKEEILKEIQLIRDMIEQNKKKINSLNAQLRNSGIKIASLQARIDTMDIQIARHEKDMATLKMELVDRNFEIGQLNEKVGTLEITMADQETKISEQRAEMNKAFVVSGTYKELREKGLLIKEGRVLGLGGKESLQENALLDNLFTKIDISETRTIPVNSKAVKLVTEHPASSYSLVRDEDDKIDHIEINDPTAFWKISKYAVVEVAN
jgi:chromosome segregation ATPase